MVRSSQAWLKCCIWFAALLAPFQGLQGPPVFCRLMGCGLAQSDGSQTRFCCRCSRICSHATTKTPRTASDSVAAIHLPCAHAPGTCPQHCFCRHPSQPQPNAKPSSSMTAVAVFTAAHYCSRHLQVAIRQNPPLSQRDSTPAYAQQICAVRCRFIA